MYVERQIELVVGARNDDILVFFVLEHIGGTYCPAYVAVAKCLRILFESSLSISTGDFSAHVPVPESALHTAEGCEPQAFDGIYFHAGAADRVVDAERALFVSAEYETAAELLVEVAEGEFAVAVFAFYEYVCKAPALECFFKSGEGVLEVFDACATVDIFTEYAGIGVEVAENFVGVVLGADVVVVFGKKDIGLYISMYRHFVGDAVACVLCGRRQ